MPWLRTRSSHAFRRLLRSWIDGVSYVSESEGGGTYISVPRPFPGATTGGMVGWHLGKVLVAILKFVHGGEERGGGYLRKPRHSVSEYRALD